MFNGGAQQTTNFFLNMTLPSAKELESIRKHFVTISIVALVMSNIYLFKTTQNLQSEYRTEKNSIIERNTEATIRSGEIMRENTRVLRFLVVKLNIDKNDNE